MKETSNGKLRGIVKWFSEEKGYGFIAVTGRPTDIFVHWSGIAGEGRRNLIKGDVVEFYIEPSKLTQKDVAVDVIKVG